MLKDKNILKSSDFSAEEKAHIINSLVAEGCTKSTAYVRLFRDGFVQWQLDGIVNTVREYASQNNLSLAEPLDAEFYSTLPSREKFKEFMKSRGMCWGTTIQRFTEWNFKPWELKGVRHLLPHLY